MATIGITGGTGFVGTNLSRLLVSKGYQVIIFTRGQAKAAQGKVAYAHLDATKQECDTDALGKLDALVNMAGAGIADERWSDKRKQEIVTSRVDLTRFLVSRLKTHAPGCKTFVSASATGYYGGDRGDARPFTETSIPSSDFLGTTCRAWEEAAQEAETIARTVILRFGIVLGKESGAFPLLVKPLSFGIKPTLGSGIQVVSWIEVTDLARMILYALEQQKLTGIYNAVAPTPVAHKTLMNTIAKEKGGIHIPAPAPAFVLQIMLGEMSKEILQSCTVSAQKILDAGFTFSYPDIASATKAILDKG